MKSNSANISVYRISAELLAGCFVGVLIGLYLDKWLSTSPLCLVICTILGFGAGLRNIFRMGKENDKSARAVRGEDANTN